MVSLGVVVSAPGTLATLWKKRQIVGEQREVLERLRRENEELRKKLTQVQSPEYVEEVARDKLGFVKEGEKIVILPRAQKTELNDQKENPQVGIPKWKKWWRLFW